MQTRCLQVTSLQSRRFRVYPIGSETSLAADIIEPARSPWRAQVLVVTQGTKRRLVIDYSTTINRFTLLDAYPLPNIK